MSLLPDSVITLVRQARRIVALTGGGVASEAKFPSFRESHTGEWARYDVSELATPQAFQRNPRLVWEWYAHRRRVAELRDEVEDALAVEDDDRAAATQRELDALVTELARAFGLGGRSRKASSTIEKARLNVTRALRAAVRRITQALPDAGAVLDRRVRTGLFCAYEPHPDDSVIWTAQS